MTVLSDGMLMGAGGPAGVQLIAESHASVVSGGSITLNRPAATAIGDLLVAIIWGANMSSCSLAGWTAAATDFSGTQTYAILTRAADGSESSTFAFSSTSTRKNGIVLQFRGGASAVDVIGAPTEASSATSTAASLTAGNAGILIAAFMLTTNGQTISTPPSGMTQVALENGSLSAATYKADPSPAGATGGKTLVWTASNTNSGIGLQVH